MLLLAVVVGWISTTGAFLYDTTTRLGGGALGDICVANEPFGYCEPGLTCQHQHGALPHHLGTCVRYTYTTTTTPFPTTTTPPLTGIYTGEICVVSESFRYCEPGTFCQHQPGNMAIHMGVCVRHTDRLSTTPVPSTVMMTTTPPITANFGGTCRLFTPNSCRRGLQCVVYDHLHNPYVGRCEPLHIKRGASELSPCQRRRLQAMLSMVVWSGKWTPQCDPQGNYRAMQCDFSGHCFCVDRDGMMQGQKVQGNVSCPPL